MQGVDFPLPARYDARALENDSRATGLVVPTWEPLECQQRLQEGGTRHAQKSGYAKHRSGANARRFNQLGIPQADRNSRLTGGERTRLQTRVVRSPSFLCAHRAWR